MLSPAGLAALQEDLHLEPDGRFEFTVNLESLGIDRARIEPVVAAGPLCFLDFEATGLDPKLDELIEAGAIRIDAGAPKARIFNTLIHTGQELTPFIKRLTGITQRDVVTAPPLAEVAAALDRFIGDAPVVAHNAAFEKSWLAQAVNRRFASHPFLDTVEILALVYPDSANMKLDTFCRRGLGRGERHRALDDALDMLRVLVGTLVESHAGSPAAANAVAALTHFHPTSAWRVRLERSVGYEFADAAATAAVPVLPEVSLEPVPFSKEAIVARLHDVDGVQRVLPGYELRPGQVRFFEQVFDCFAASGGKSVVVGEAGTGIGKTLGYLAAAIPFARHSGQQVVISTSSKLLQTQLLEKDIPAAASLLGYPDLRFGVMKGRGNYICKRRLDRFLRSRQSEGPTLDPEEGYASALIAAFSTSATHGEIDRVPTVLYQLNPCFERFAREVTSSDSDECSRQNCETVGGHCVFRAARHRLEAAEIAVVNHDLLLRWPPDYPELRHLVFDEAHELIDKADNAYARTAEGIELAHRLEEILGMRGSPPLADDDETQMMARRALTLVSMVGETSRRIVKAENEESPFQFGRDELLVPRSGPGPEWKELTDAALELATSLRRLSLRFRGGDDDESESKMRLVEVLDEAASVLDHALPYPKSDTYVYRLRGLARSTSVSWRFVATPVLPGDDFRDNVLERAQTMLATSATLSVADEDDGALRELKLAVHAGSRYRVATPIPSPFDYEKNLEVIFIKDMTDQAALVDRMTRSLAIVSRRLGGRTLGLFTSRDRMVRVADLLAGQLAADGITVTTPAAGNTDPHELVRTFRENPRAVLLGSRGFWQGIDIPGDACQAVVIEKLPFDVPGDPLLQLRAEVLFGGGSRVFSDYQVPRMLLRLKQMMGRLIRTPTDRGIIVLVEPRVDKPYFRKVLASLPPGARHHLARLDDLDAVVEDFLRRSGLAAAREKVLLD
ncbi:MAG TPA: helicase C-terminal domain-containing protein [Candidatus Binatia bacterium]